MSNLKGETGINHYGVFFLKFMFSFCSIWDGVLLHTGVWYK